MLDAAKLLDRLASFGATLQLEDDRLRLTNAIRLPQEAKDYIAKHKAEIATYLREVVEPAFEERAAIIEFDGKVPRQWLDQWMLILRSAKPAKFDELEWTDFVTRAGRIIDELPELEAA